MAKAALLAVVILLTGARFADACVCVFVPVCQGFWDADAVFTGVVTSVTRSDSEGTRLSHTTIVIERGFKGARGQVVLTANENSSCHYNFTVGQRYFVYAGRQPDGTLTTSSCSGNKLLDKAGEDLDYAERLPPPGSGGRIFGEVRRIELDLLDGSNSRDVYPSDLAVTLRDSSGNALELRTSEKGRFEAAGVKPGE
jgi:hypothetical protein